MEIIGLHVFVETSPGDGIKARESFLKSIECRVSQMRNVALDELEANAPENLSLPALAKKEYNDYVTRWDTLNHKTNNHFKDSRQNFDDYREMVLEQIQGHRPQVPGRLWEWSIPPLPHKW